VRPLAGHLGELLADAGGPLVAVPVLLACAALAAWRTRRTGAGRWWLPMAAAAATALLIPLLVVPAKAWFDRPGPGEQVLTAGHSGWYPSGHAATAAIAYGAAALLLARATTRARARTSLGVTAAVVSAGTGLGLLWRDYHWFLDVLGSWCLPGIVLWLLARLLAAVRPSAGS
jgi:undecaprenyl-diphosphatase